MKNLTKLQREILQSAVDVMESHGIKQPIHCVMGARAEIDKYSKSYAAYSCQMYALADAGVIGESDGSHCYVINYLVASRLLAGEALS